METSSGCVWKWRISHGENDDKPLDFGIPMATLDFKQTLTAQDMNLLQTHLPVGKHISHHSHIESSWRLHIGDVDAASYPPIFMSLYEQKRTCPSNVEGKEHEGTQKKNTVPNHQEIKKPISGKVHRYHWPISLSEILRRRNQESCVNSVEPSPASSTPWCSFFWRCREGEEIELIHNILQIRIWMDMDSQPSNSWILHDLAIFCIRFIVNPGLHWCCPETTSPWGFFEARSEQVSTSQDLDSDFDFDTWINDCSRWTSGRLRNKSGDLSHLETKGLESLRQDVQSCQAKPDSSLENVNWLDSHVAAWHQYPLGLIRFTVLRDSLVDSLSPWFPDRFFSPLSEYNENLSQATHFWGCALVQACWQQHRSPDLAERFGYTLW